VKDLAVFDNPRQGFLRAHWHDGTSLVWLNGALYDQAARYMRPMYELIGKDGLFHVAAIRANQAMALASYGNISP
jgi:hypothetical protein